MKYVSLSGLRFDGRPAYTEIVDWVDKNVSELNRCYVRWLDCPNPLIGVTLDPEQEVIFKLKFGL